MASVIFSPLKSKHVSLNRPANLENSAVATGLEKVSIPIPKKGNAKECSNYHTIALISHTSQVMLQILQARLKQYVNHELPDVQAGFIFYFIFKLYNIVLVLSYIEMNPPQTYMCSPSWTLLPPPSPYHPSGSSQCTRNLNSRLSPDSKMQNHLL